MRLVFNNRTKILLVSVGFIFSVLGFMVKLPAAFRHFDKELHALFYFFAAAFLNLLFAKKNIIVHLVIFGLLYVFGVGIEYAQEYSNTLLHKKIHGRFDIEDVHSNLKGLIACSIAWIIYVASWFVYKKAVIKKTVNTEV